MILRSIAVPRGFDEWLKSSTNFVPDAFHNHKGAE
jgi:hypothetical protein